MKKILQKFLFLNKNKYNNNNNNWLANLNIPRVFFIKCIPPFHGTHVTLYIEFKLLYKFSILITLVQWRDLN